MTANLPFKRVKSEDVFHSNFDASQTQLLQSSKTSHGERDSSIVQLSTTTFCKVKHGDRYTYDSNVYNQRLRAK